MDSRAVRDVLGFRATLVLEAATEVSLAFIGFLLAVGQAGVVEALLQIRFAFVP